MTDRSKSTDKPKLPRGRRGAKPQDDSQATVEEFDREHLGVAPKE